MQDQRRSSREFRSSGDACDAFEINYGKPMPNEMPLLPKPAAGLGAACPGCGRGASIASSVSAPATSEMAVKRVGSTPCVLETMIVSPTLTSAIEIVGNRSSISLMLNPPRPPGPPGPPGPPPPCGRAGLPCRRLALADHQRRSTASAARPDRPSSRPSQSRETVATLHPA